MSNYIIWQTLIVVHFTACYVLFVTHLQPRRRSIKYAILYALLGGISIALMGEPIPDRVLFFAMLMLWDIRLSVHLTDVIRDIRMAAFRARRATDVKRTFWGSPK